MDASQLTRIRMEAAQQYKSRAQPAVDASLQTYRTMIKAAAGGCAAQPAQPLGLVEQCPNCDNRVVGTVQVGDTFVRQTRTLAQEGHLRLGSQGSASQIVSADAIAYRRAGRAECAGPTPSAVGITVPMPGCGDCSGAIYGEPGRYDPLHPDPRLIVPAPCGIPAEERRVVQAPCANDSTPYYDTVAGTWTHQDGGHLVYPLLPSA
jgi:hypothetical protein